MGLIFRGRLAILYLILGLALGAAGALLAPHYILVAALWTLAALLPQETTEPTPIAVAMIGGFIARWLLLDRFAASNIYACFIAVETVPRAAMIAMAWVSRPANTGPIDRFLAALNTPIALASIAVGVAAAFATGVRQGIVIVLAVYLVIRAIRWFAYRMLDGIHASALGLAQLLIEFSLLALFGCAICKFAIT